MTWATPKTDWTTDDGIAAADLNRIEENIAHIGPGEGTATAAQNLDIGILRYYNVTPAAPEIERIKKTGRVAGDLVFFAAEAGGSLTFKPNIASSGEYAGILLTAGNSSMTLDSGAIGFIYDGSKWRNIW